jgi:hypothetical protein
MPDVWPAALADASPLPFFGISWTASVIASATAPIARIALPISFSDPEPACSDAFT